MRVIAGTARGRVLTAPRGLHTRPTPGRVKEALFSMLGAAVVDAVVLDLFAGTGALGLEALSRGASRAVFVDKDRQALKALAHNVATVAPDRVEVLAMPAERALRLFKGRSAQFDLVFLDPPYDLDLLPATLRTLAADELVQDGGLVVCEHHGKRPPPVPPADWQQQQSRRYGDVAVTILNVGKGAFT
jgi:16S rRNA (guanine966-N2)-methyltransferase